MERLKRNIQIIWTLAILTVTYACGSDDRPTPAPELKPDAVIINTDDTKQVIRGFGAATAFRLNYALTNDDMDLLFGTSNTDIGLSILRIRVASDQDVSARTIELNHAKGATARNAIVVASPWSPPARMKTNNNLVGGSLKPEYYEAYAKYLNDFANFMHENNAPLYAISVQNEPDIEVDYESCDWTSDQLKDFLANHGHHLSSTQVIAAESFNFNHGVTDPLLNDAAAEGNIDIIGGHIYGGGLNEYPLARIKGKEVWMTEHLDTETTWEAVLATGKEMHDCLVTANFNAYIWWYAKRFYGPLDEDGTISKRGYIMSNFARFIRPGYYRVEATKNPKTGVFVSAYFGNGKTVVVAINMSELPQVQQFKFEGEERQSIHPFVTTETENMSAKDMLPTTGINTFTYTLRPRSVTTFACE